MSRTKHEHEYTYEDRVRDDKRENKIRHEEYETKNYGTVTYERDPRDSKYNKIVAVPVEIEVPSELDQLVKLDILPTVGMSYSEWIEQCYHERMKQILTDPAEFGKVVLWHIKRGHCFEDDDL
jgi:hypothetical protein